jgi:calcineurin-like phosphoesterase family protein
LGVLLAIGAAVAVAQDDDPLRPPEGEWIPSLPGETARLWAVGDANPPNSKRVTRLIKRADPDRVLYLGDVYGLADGAAFDRWEKPWGYLINRMAPTPGNHEWKEAQARYESFWRDVTGETPPTYYSFRAGGWDVLSVNGEHSDSDAVESWLTEQASAGGNCRLAFWHRPAYSAGKYEQGDARARQYWDALAGGARIIVNGHDHDMQRLRPRDGIVEFISGAGGRHRHNVDEKDPKLAFGDDGHFGALRLRLSFERAKWRFVSARGRVLDKGSLRCQT